MNMLKNIIPSVYLNLLPEKLLTLNVNETETDCGDCLMSKDGKYLKSLKCCTFQPFLPNYMVGQILKEGSERHIEHIKNLAREKSFLLPIGLTPTYAYQFKFNSKEEGDFGNDPELLCPFYDRLSLGCSIWQMRGSECMSFHCYSRYGAKGEVFWTEFKDLIFDLEMSLSQECLVQKGYTVSEVEEQIEWIRWNDGKIAVESISTVDYSRLWAHHFDNIFEFYIACYGHVKSLHRKDVLNLLDNPNLIEQICEAW